MKIKKLKAGFYEMNTGSKKVLIKMVSKLKVNLIKYSKKDIPLIYLARFCNKSTIKIKIFDLMFKY